MTVFTRSNGHDHYSTAPNAGQVAAPPALRVSDVWRWCIQ